MDKPVWLTELGYTVGPGPHPAVTPAQQADYLAGAVTHAQAELPCVEMLTMWNLSYGRDPGDEMAGFSLVEVNAAPRPAYWRLKVLIGPSHGVMALGQARDEAVFYRGE